VYIILLRRACCPSPPTILWILQSGGVGPADEIVLNRDWRRTREIPSVCRSTSTRSPCPGRYFHVFSRIRLPGSTSLPIVIGSNISDQTSTWPWVDGAHLIVEPLRRIAYERRSFLLPALARCIRLIARCSSRYRGNSASEPNTSRSAESAASISREPWPPMHRWGPPGRLRRRSCAVIVAHAQPRTLVDASAGQQLNRRYGVGPRKSRFGSLIGAKSRPSLYTLPVFSSRTVSGAPSRRITFIRPTSSTSTSSTHTAFTP